MKPGSREFSKVCSRCKEAKSSTLFNTNNSTKDRKVAWCKSCHSAYNTEWLKKHPERKNKQKDAGLKSRFGMGLVEYRQLLQKQNWVCAICSQPDPHGRSLAVDHCHKTGRIRGLLCFWCNTGLGLFKDDPILLRKSIGYLK